MYKNAANLYNTLLVIYFNYYDIITDEEKKEMDKRYDPSYLFLKNYKYDEWYKKDEEKKQITAARKCYQKSKIKNYLIYHH